MQVNNMNEIKITIVIPTYYPKDYLWDCLNSIESQSLKKTYYEVIIVLNGEKEPYFENIKNRLNHYTFHSRLLYSELGSVSNARNIGIDNTRSRFITFIDDDDWISPTYLEQLLSSAGSDTIVESNVIAINEETTSRKDHFLGNAFQKNKLMQKLNIVNSRSFFSSACCKLIDINTIGKERFMANITHGEDAFFMYKISNRVKNIKLTAEDAIYYIRERTNSASRSKRMKKKKKKMEIKMLYLYSKTYIQHPLKYNFIFTATRIIATIRKLLVE